MHPLYYYFGTPDSDSVDDSYDPTCECFHIDRTIVSDSEAEAVVGGNTTPPHIELPSARDEAQFLGAAQEAQLEQIQELQAMLDKKRENLRLLQQTLERERAACARGRGARERACDVNRRIIEDRVGEPPVFNRASQNIIAAAMLLRNMPEPSTSEACQARDEIRGLLEAATMQQAESSASRHRGLASEQPAEPSRQKKEASVHPELAPRGNKAAPIREHIVDNCEPRDAHNDIN
jgi:hypothetical protein